MISLRLKEERLGFRGLIMLGLSKRCFLLILLAIELKFGLERGSDKMPYDPKLELRKVHRKQAGGELGSMAELHSMLVSKGFAFIYEKGKNSGHEGIQKYVDQQGRQAVMKRVEKGASARWLPPKRRGSGMLVKVRTAAMPDLWQLIMGREK